MITARITAAVTPALGAAAVGLALATAGAAAASTTDDAFVAQLNSHGISVGTPQQTVNQGRQVCAGMAAGKNAAVMALETLGRTNLTPRQAGFFVGAAAKAYCPQLPVQLP
jgi:Protein of unknown function (DUF732)